MSPTDPPTPPRSPLRALRRAVRGLFPPKERPAPPAPQAPQAPSDFARLYAAAEEAQRRGALDEAMAEYRRLHETGVAGADPLIRRALILSELGRIAEAEAELRRAADEQPELPWALLRLAHMLEGLGRPLTTEALRREALARDQHPEVQVFLTLSQLQLRRFDQARRHALALPAELPDWWAGVRVRSLAAYAGRLAEARALLRRRRRERLTYAEAYDLGEALLTLGRLSAAQRLSAFLMRTEPDAYAAFDLERRRLERVEGPAAADAFMQSLASRFAAEPSYRRARILLAHDLGRSGDVLALLHDGGEVDVAGDVRSAQATALLRLGRHEELQSVCRAWLAASPSSTVPAGYVTASVLRERPVDDGAETGDAWAGVVLAQFWDKRAIPADVRAAMESWDAHHPDLPHRIFDEEAAREFLRDGFGGAAVEVFDHCTHAAMKADVFRIGFLLHAGGVWADADERCVRPMRGLLVQAPHCELLAPLSGSTPGYVHNFFMGARAGGALLQGAFDEACAEVGRLAREGRKPDIWQTTGPGLITRAAARRLLQDDVDPRAVRLFSLAQYRACAHTDVELGYKLVPETNWHAQ